MPPVPVRHELEVRTDRSGRPPWVCTVPHLATATEAARRRFANLVDVARHRDDRLVVLAAGPPEHVLDANTTDHERTASRFLSRA